MTVLLVAGGVTLDALLGEPRRAHPLIGFGRCAAYLERRWNCTPPADIAIRKGAAAVTLLVLPFTAIAGGLTLLPVVGGPIELLLLYLTLGQRSLHEHALPVMTALQANDASRARTLAGHLVSRDPQTLDIPAATTESVLENGNDAVFGALFWFVLAGGAGAVCYRLVNTLDAMWGYRNTRFLYFGRAAARLDDLLNYIPARLTALSYALLGHTGKAIACWRKQAAQWESPNAGPVMAAGAGALGISLGGPARYHGEWRQRPLLGQGPPAVAADIGRALRLLRHGVILWLLLLLLLDGWLMHA